MNLIGPLSLKILFLYDLCFYTQSPILSHFDYSGIDIENS